MAGQGRLAMWLLWSLTFGILLTQAAAQSAETDTETHINLTWGSPVEIVSRDYPSDYPASFVDTWLVVSPQDSLIALEVLDFQTETYPTARDILYIGTGLNYTLKDTRVQQILPTDYKEGTAGKVRRFISVGPEMWLQFTSDRYEGNERGFKVQLQPVNKTETCSHDQHVCRDVMVVCLDVTAVCDGPPQCSDASDEAMCEPCGQTSIDLSQVASHTLTSPKHPDDFLYEIVCYWLINASDASSIQLSFVDFFLDEREDLFSVGIGQDPTNVTSTLTMRRGNVVPITMVVKSDQMWISFATEGSPHFRSLMQVKLQQFEPQVCGEGRVACDSGLACIPQTAVCDGWPDCSDQSDELNCDSCPVDLSTCSCFQESFICNGQIECADFYDELHCATCGAPFIDLTNQSSPVTLTSPYYPAKYPRQTACLWLITAEPSHRILVKFTDFKLNIETLSLGNGHLPSNASSLLLSRYGSTTPTMVSSEGSKMWMVFETLHTGQSSLFRGYSLELSQFTTVECETDDEFSCLSGHQCVDISNRCNAITDCWDFSDEIGCDPCTPDQLSCMNGECVEIDGICDGYVDCRDFTDEASCGTLCGEGSIYLTSEEPAYRLTSPDLLILNERYPPAYSCLWLISTHPQLQLVVKLVDISINARIGDIIQMGDNHDPSNPSSNIVILEGKDGDNLVGRSFLSSGSKMWVAMVSAKSNNFMDWAGWGMFDLEISRHNVSGECVDGYQCRYGSICVPQTDWCNGISNCVDYSDEQYCDHCGTEMADDIDLSNGSFYVFTAHLTRHMSLFPLGKDCLWFVTAQSGYRIQLRFLYFILISDKYYYFNGIKVGSGSNPGNESSIFFQHTGEAVREVVTSSSSDIWIVVETYKLQIQEGFAVLLTQYEETVCSSDQYTCPSGLMCIDKSQQCDGIPDCPDAGDEFGCAGCSSSQLQCDGDVCVDAENICNQKANCQDGLDERICAPCGDTLIHLPPDPNEVTLFNPPSYSFTEYPWDMECTWLLTALDNYLIQLEFLDFKTEANFDKLSTGNGHDRRDESSVILGGISGEEAPRMILSDGNLMWIRFKSDYGVRDRGFQIAISQVNESVGCAESETSCASGPGLVCLQYESQCNGIVLCPDGSDETACGDCGSNLIYMYGTETHNLTSPGFPGDYLANLPCNWRIVTVEKPSEDLTSDTNPWRILATIELFDLENQYDYLTLYNLGDGGQTVDLIARLTGKIKLTTVVSSGPEMLIKFTSDSTGSGKGFVLHFQPVNKTSDFCRTTDFNCNGNELCVAGNAQCNGFNDCLQYQDETNCAEINCPGDYMCEDDIVTDHDLLEFECITMDLVCNGRIDCPEGDDEQECDKKKCPRECSCGQDVKKGLSIKCLGSWEQRTVDDMAKTVASLSLNGGNVTVLRKGTFKGMNSLRTLSLNDNNIRTIEARTFDGLENLTWLELSGNDITELESYTFQELSTLDILTLWNVPLQTIRTNAFKGLVKLKQLTLIRGIIDNPLHVENQGFAGLKNLQKLFVDDHRLCCYFKDANIECASLEPRPPLFMCSNLMPNLTLRVFMWILGISALIGNFAIVVWRFREKNTKTSRQVHSLLVLNLAVSDFLMGVYMIIIAVADIYYGDDYFNQASEWRSTVMCKVASVLSIVSSEASVFIVTIITVDRFLCIVFPFSQAHLRRKTSRIIVTIVWCAVIVLSVVPTILADEESSVYGLSDVCIGLPLQTRAADYASTTQSIGSPFSNETFKTSVGLGYEPSWVYSIVLFLGVNLVCFLIILVCYVVIFVHVKMSLKQVNRHMNRHEEIKMAGKMALIVGTDLVCWLPIIVMGILAQTGAVRIPVEMYAWIVVFILPINSSLNPYLYTISSCIAERRREHVSTATTASNKLPMASKTNVERSVHTCTQEISIVD